MKAAFIRITKQFRFEAAHALWNYDGLCRNIHGHSYVLYVTIAGVPIADPAHAKCGMLMDFSVLKQIVHTEIVDLFDHALMINGNSPHKEMAQNEQLLGKVLSLPYQPTCENMVADFASRLKASLPAGIMLFSLKLHETTTAYAEWFASDNM